jgi:glycosyltransferase involved in cell wall biosynthesis
VSRDGESSGWDDRPTTGGEGPGRRPGARPSSRGEGPATRPPRVCLVIDRRFEAAREPEIGPTYLVLADLLRDAGHEVTPLDTGGPGATAGPPCDAARQRGVRAVRRIPLPASPAPLASSSAELAVSYRVYLWLRDHDEFDVIHFPDRGGAGYYAMTARRQGLALARTACVVGLFGCSAWQRLASHDILRNECELERDFIERRSAEMADAVWSPTGAAIAWAEAQGWALPGRAEVREIPGDGGWPRWHEDLARRDEGPATAGLPSISVCINHYNRPHYLRQALASIVDQEHAPLEAIVLDDGSPGEGVQAELDRIVEEFAFHRRGWRLVRERDLYLGASRNAAAREARGDYILFMDDDNVAKPHELATFARVARHTDADVLTCLLDMFEGRDRPSAQQPPTWRHLFPGAAFPLCVIRNTFGDSNALVRRRALWELGGFTEDRGVGHEDWEAYSKFALRGYRVEVIPEALFFYRTAPGSMTQRVSVVRNHLRSLRPHLERIPRPYHALIELAMGQLLARWGYLDPPPAPVESTEQTALVAPPGPEWQPLPLRYRVADAINERIKSLRPMHRLAKRLIQAGWRPSRTDSRAG